MKHYQTTIGLNLLYQEQRQEAGPEFLAPSAIAGVRSFSSFCAWLSSNAISKRCPL